MPNTAADVHVADLVETGNDLHMEEEGHTAGASTARKTAPSSPQSRGFRLDIFPAPEYNHQYAMSGKPEHHAWPASYETDKSFEAATLKQVLPHNMARKGLAHWQMDLGTVGNQGSKGRRLQLKNWLPSKMRSQ
jgi:hypothetical protein